MGNVFFGASIIGMLKIPSPLEKARCAETLVLLDGAHALGQVPIDMKQMAEAGVDAYATWQQLHHSGT